MKAAIFIEGAGSSNPRLDATCRQAIGRFIEKAGVNTHNLVVESYGPGSEAYKEFVRGSLKYDWTVLLVDSESPFSGQSTVSVQSFLRAKYPNETQIADQQPAFLMVQCMESWLLSDLDCVKKYYGSNPAPLNVIKASTNLELLTARDAESAINKFALNSKKRKYTKAHGFEILGLIDPEKVTKRFSQAKDFIDCLKSHLH